MAVRFNGPQKRTDCDADELFIDPASGYISKYSGASFTAYFGAPNSPPQKSMQSTKDPPQKKIRTRKKLGSFPVGDVRNRPEIHEDQSQIIGMLTANLWQGGSTQILKPGLPACYAAKFRNPPLKIDKDHGLGCACNTKDEFLQLSGFIVCSKTLMVTNNTMYAPYHQVTNFGPGVTLAWTNDFLTTLRTVIASVAYAEILMLAGVVNRVSFDQNGPSATIDGWNLVHLFVALNYPETSLPSVLVRLMKKAVDERKSWIESHLARDKQKNKDTYQVVDYMCEEPTNTNKLPGEWDKKERHALLVARYCGTCRQAMYLGYIRTQKRYLCFRCHVAEDVDLQPTNTLSVLCPEKFATNNLRGAGLHLAEFGYVVLTQVIPAKLQTQTLGDINKALSDLNKLPAKFCPQRTEYRKSGLIRKTAFNGRLDDTSLQVMHTVCELAKGWFVDSCGGPAADGSIHASPVAWSLLPKTSEPHTLDLELHIDRDQSGPSGYWQGTQRKSTPGDLSQVASLQYCAIIEGSKDSGKTVLVPKSQLDYSNHMARYLESPKVTQYPNQTVPNPWHTMALGAVAIEGLEGGDVLFWDDRVVHGNTQGICTRAAVHGSIFPHGTIMLPPLAKACVVRKDCNTAKVQELKLGALLGKEVVDPMPTARLIYDVSLPELCDIYAKNYLSGPTNVTVAPKRRTSARCSTLKLGIVMLLPTILNED